MLTDQIESGKNDLPITGSPERAKDPSLFSIARRTSARLDIRAAGRLGAESYPRQFASVARMTGREQRYGRIKSQH